MNVDKTRKELFVHPGDILITTESDVMWTILGSCVAVILYDVKKKCAGMNHYMLPHMPDKEVSTGMYGDVSINNLVKRMLARGCEIEDLRARIVGGAERTNKTFEIGRKNIVVAFEILRKLKINIVCSSVGGERGRKIKFITGKCQLYIKTLEEAQKIDSHLLKTLKQNP